MPCPHCCSARTTERSDRTAHGYRRFRCQGCGRGFNERTGSVLNRLQLPTDVVFLIVLWRLRMKLSLRDLAEILLLRGLVFSHEAIRNWEAKLAPLLTEVLLQGLQRLTDRVEEPGWRRQEHTGDGKAGASVQGSAVHV